MNLVESIVINVVENVINVIDHKTKFKEPEPNNSKSDKSILLKDVIYNVIDSTIQKPNKIYNQISNQKQQISDQTKLLRKIDVKQDDIENDYMNDDVLKGRVS